MRIGIDLGGTKIEGIVLDAGRKVRARRRIPSPRGDYDDTLSAICGMVEHLETECGATCSVGIGMPGAISPASGLVKNANSTWLNGRPFGPDLEDRLGREVRLANDADCFALSEAKDGAGAGCRTVFGVIIGTGTGGGIVHDGRLLSGPNAIAGEWGHNPLPWPHEDERPGPPCYCGKQGCIETWTSGPGLAAAFERETGRTATAEEIAGAAQAGDPDSPVRWHPSSMFSIPTWWCWAAACRISARFTRCCPSFCRLMCFPIRYVHGSSAIAMEMPPAGAARHGSGRKIKHHDSGHRKRGRKGRAHARFLPGLLHAAGRPRHPLSGLQSAASRLA
jgi:fructokinase